MWFTSIAILVKYITRTNWTIDCYMSKFSYVGVVRVAYSDIKCIRKHVRALSIGNCETDWQLVLI